MDLNVKLIRNLVGMFFSDLVVMLYLKDLQTKARIACAEVSLWLLYVGLSSWNVLTRGGDC